MVEIHFVLSSKAFTLMVQDEYRACVTSGQWHRQVNLPDGDKVMIHSPRAIIHYVGAGLEGEFPTAVSVNVSHCCLFFYAKPYSLFC